MVDLELRPETDADHAAIVELTRRAFWNVHRPGCDEHYLVHVLRGHPDCRADLNRVAEVGGRIAGHILTRGRASWPTTARRWRRSPSDR